MKKTGCIIGVCLLLLTGCGLQSPYDSTSAERASLSIASDAYHLSNQTLTMLEKSTFEEAEIVYYAQDEAELAKVLQYAIDQGIQEIAYQSEKQMDLDELASILSVLNPYDLSLTQNETNYTNTQGKTLYTAHHITIKNLDERYAAATQEAQKRVERLIHDDMSLTEKITVIHNDIILHSVYEEQEQGDGQQHSELFQAASVLLDGSGVCTSYSRAFMLMAQAADIPAIYVSSEQMNHGWNYVLDADGWRYIDVTWDDPVPDVMNQAQSTFLYMDPTTFFQEGTHVLSRDERQRVEHIAEIFFSD